MIDRAFLTEASRYYGIPGIDPYGVDMLAPMLIAEASEDIKKRFLPPIGNGDVLWCELYSEPNAGSDLAALSTTAIRKGNEYIINGVKHFTSNGGVAKLYMVYARTKKGVPLNKGMSLFMVPHKTPGLSIGHFHNKLGRRLMLNAEEIFEDARVPDKYLVGTENKALEERKGAGPVTLLHCANIVGTLRTCYEESLDYAKTRVQGGKPIIGHYTVAAKLGSMKVKVDALRTILWWTASSWDNEREYDPRMDWLIKGYADDIAVDVIHKMMDIFGGMSTDKEMPVEKYIRDVSTILHGFGTGEMNYVKGGLLL